MDSLLLLPPNVKLVPLVFTVLVQDVPLIAPLVLLALTQTLLALLNFVPVTATSLQIKISPALLRVVSLLDGQST